MMYIPLVLYIVQCRQAILDPTGIKILIGGGRSAGKVSIYKAIDLSPIKLVE